MSHSEEYFREVAQIASSIDTEKVEQMTRVLNGMNPEGRVFVLGIGGSAGNSSHMVNDLRKLCNIEAYAPTDNISELTARTNDEGFDTIFSEYLKVSKFNYKDILFILSVGGGSLEKKLSVALINAIYYARSTNSIILGIVGKHDGYTALNGDSVIVVPTINKDRITPHSESFQSVIWHALVSNPKLQRKRTQW